MDNSLKIKSKRFIKKVFNKLGYKVSRIPPVKKAPNELIKFQVGKYAILLTGDSQLPLYLRSPFYSTNLPRLAEAVKEKYKDFIMIDVGANVGDTVALVKSKCDIPIVCIEGDAYYFKVLKKNLENFNSVFSYEYFLGEENKTINAQWIKNNETARIYNINHPITKESLHTITLDDFLEKNSQFKIAKLLKIDTDGYDLKIIRGGLRYITKTKPVLFFEYDTVYLSEQREDGLSVLTLLENSGYRDIIFYDNGGKIILSTDLSNHLLLKQMDRYVDKEFRTPFSYYDVAIFHKEDEDLAKKFIRDEMFFFYKEKI